MNPLDLTDCDFVFGPVLKFGSAGRLMRSHLLGMFEPASVLQLNRHTGKRGSCFVDALKQRLFVVDTHFGKVLIDSFLDLVVCRHFMLLAAFLMKP